MVEGVGATGFGGGAAGAAFLLKSPMSKVVSEEKVGDVSRGEGGGVYECSRWAKVGLISSDVQQGVRIAVWVVLLEIISTRVDYIFPIMHL